MLYIEGKQTFSFIWLDKPILHTLQYLDVISLSYPSKILCQLFIVYLYINIPNIKSICKRKSQEYYASFHPY